MRLLYSMEASVRLREKRRARAKKKALQAKKAEAERLAAGLPPKRPTWNGAEASSDSESEADHSGVAHKGDHDPGWPRWTRVHPTEDPKGCSVYMCFVQYAWAHRPAALPESDFWPLVQREARSFTEHEGWWPRTLWQALFGEWCGGSAVVLCPGMAYQMATMHENIHTRREFETVGARSPAALCWFTGVLWTVPQLQAVLSTASNKFLHRGAMILRAGLLGTATVQDMLATGWLASGMFRLRLQRVWKRARAPSVQRVQVSILHQQPEEPPEWLMGWDDAQVSQRRCIKGTEQEAVCPYRTLQRTRSG